MAALRALGGSARGLRGSARGLRGSAACGARGAWPAHLGPMPQRGFHATRRALEKPLWHYYFVMGMEKGATQAEIKQRYYAIVKDIHPDQNPSPENAERFKEVSEAFEFLSHEGHQKLTKHDVRRNRRNNKKKPARAATKKAKPKGDAAKGDAAPEERFLITSGMWWKNQVYP